MTQTEALLLNTLKQLQAQHSETVNALMKRLDILEQEQQNLMHLLINYLRDDTKDNSDLEKSLEQPLVRLSS